MYNLACSLCFGHRSEASKITFGGAAAPARPWRRLTQTFGYFISAASIAGCALASPYNPAGLSEGQLSRISDICQSAMGLSPNEPPILGPGDPRLADGENHYQGCIAALSDSVSRVGEAYGAVRADQDCRARGFAEGTPGLAECVLRSERTEASVRPMSATPVSDEEAVAPGSFYRARPHEETQRVELACARLGLNPVGEPFDDCVKEMKDTFFAIDNPQN
jgi:hypothetical protein